MILAGCPIQNREKYVKGYLEAFENQTYPIKDIHMCFLVNDSTDKTEELLLEYKKDHNFGKFTVISVTGMGYVDNPRNRSKNEYTKIARVRNLFLDRLNEETYIFSVDSDIIIPPNALERLISHKLDICSLLINNSLQDDQAYNFVTYNNKGQLVQRIRRPGVNPVALTGAAYLINAEVVRSGARYGGHRRGEDLYFCESAQKLGFGVYCDMDLEGKHLMEDRNV